jgi:hypothetical protein
VNLPPLHIKKTGLLDLSLFYRLIIPLLDASRKQRVLDALRYVNDPALYRELLEKRELGPEDDPGMSTFREEDVALQIAAGHVTPQSDPATMCIPFTVRELTMKAIASLEPPGDIQEKLDSGTRFLRPTERRRVILWPKALNDRRLELPDIDLPGLEEILGSCQAGNLFQAFDLNSSFFQIPLTPEVSRFFSFRTTEGKVYSYTVLPMGFYAACEVLQSILEAVSYVASLDRPTVTRVVYIDNVKFGCPNKGDLEEVSARFESLSRQLGLLLNEESSNRVHIEGDFCGVHYRVSREACFTKLPTAQTLKLKASFAALLRKSLTVREFTEAPRNRLFYSLPMPRNWATVESSFTGNLGGLGGSGSRGLTWTRLSRLTNSRTRDFSSCLPKNHVPHHV